MTWTRKLRHILEIADDVSEIIVNLRDNPKPLDYASIGFRLVSSSLKHYDKLGKNPFKGWKDLQLWEFKQYLFDITKHNHNIDVIREKDNVIFYATKIYGKDFGWKERDGYIDGPFVPPSESHDDALSILGRMTWEYMCSNSCMLLKKSRSDYESGTIICADNLEEQVYESQAANEILKRSQSFIEKGYNRSVMLYGKPGTGKSSAMKYIAREMGGYTLRINVSDLDNLDSEDMLCAIDLLRPDILIIDDFDRVSRPDKFLADLERFNKKIKLFIVSVNSIKSLDTAVIRPGRFDDILKLEKIDQKIVDQLIGDVSPDVYKRLSNLPIAYISEFNKRKQILGLEQAVDEVENLEFRIREALQEGATEEQSGYDDDGHIDEDPLEPGEVDWKRLIRHRVR